MAGVDQLKSLISNNGGLARTNQFLIQIPSISSLRLPRIPVFENLGLPINNILGISNTPTSSELNILCKTTQIPGKQILSRERAVGMQPETVAYGYAVADVSMTFHLLNDYGVMNFFEGWKSSIINEDVGEVGYKTDYQRDIKIHQLKRPIRNRELSLGPINIDFESNFVYSVVLENAFPTTIQPVDLTNDPNAIGELTIQISYSNVKPIRSPLGSLTLQSPFGTIGTTIGL
jgi:hypothetical protein